SGSTLVYSTYLGGSGTEFMYGVAVDSANMYVVGETSSANFPTTAALQSPGGALDAVVMTLSLDGGSFVYSSYLGGSGNDSARAVAIDSSGNLYVAGRTDSTDFPVATPFQQANGGQMDAFVAKISNSTVWALSKVDPNSGPTTGGTAIT